MSESIGNHHDKYVAASLAQKRQWFESGKGAAATQDPAEGLGKLAPLFADHASVVQRGMRDLGIAWTGSAATAATQKLQQAATWAETASRTSTAGQSSVHTYGDSFASVKNRIPKPLPEPDTGFWGSVKDFFDMQEDLYDNRKANQQANAQAVLALDLHEQATRQALTGFAEQDQPQFTTAAQATLAAGGSGQQPAAFGGGGGAPTAPAGGAPTTPADSAVGAAPGGTAGPTPGFSPGVTPSSSPSASGGTGRSAQPGRARPPLPGPAAPGNPLGKTPGNQPGKTPGNPLGYPPGGPAGGPYGSRNPGSPQPPRPNSTANTTRPGYPAPYRPEGPTLSPRGEGQPGTRFSGPPESPPPPPPPRPGHGAAGMPMGGMGGGAGRQDREHRNNVFLPSDSIFYSPVDETEWAVVPPVLGLPERPR